MVFVKQSKMNAWSMPLLRDIMLWLFWQGQAPPPSAAATRHCPSVGQEERASCLHWQYEGSMNSCAGTRWLS